MVVLCLLLVVYICLPVCFDFCQFFDE